MSERAVKYILVLGLLCCLAGGCGRERRREALQKAVDLTTQVQLLQQKVDAQERRIERLEDQVAELNKR